MKTMKLPIDPKFPIDPDTMHVGSKQATAEPKPTQFIAEHGTTNINPVLVTLVAERERLKAALRDTELYTASRALDEALSEWLNCSPMMEALALARLRAADTALEAAALADPESAKMAVQLQSITRQLRAHRAALGLN